MFKRKLDYIQSSPLSTLKLLCHVEKKNPIIQGHFPMVLARFTTLTTKACNLIANIQSCDGIIYIISWCRDKGKFRRILNQGGPSFFQAKKQILLMMKSRNSRIVRILMPRKRPKLPPRLAKRERKQDKSLRT